MLSIIISTFNRVKELENCLFHVSNQTFRDYEVIIIDQNTNLPGIEDLVKKFDNRWSFVIFRRWCIFDR